jgi:hypothetical protein
MDLEAIILGPALSRSVQGTGMGIWSWQAVDEKIWLAAMRDWRGKAALAES